MDPYALNRKPVVLPSNTPPDKKSDALSPDLLESEVSSSEGEIQRWLSPYGSNPDPVARQKGLKLYEEMMSDDQIAVCVGLRKKAFLTADWSIEPGIAGNAQAEMYAKFIQHVFDRMDGTLEDNLENIASAIEFGFSISELNYELLVGGDFNGKIGLKSIKTREPYNYNFKVDGHGNTLGLVYVGITAPPTKNGAKPETINSGLWNMPGTALLSPQGAAMGSYENPFPMEKFVHYAYNPKFNNPYGRSDLLSAFRYWNAKRFILKFWNVWLERYATPFMHATVDGSLVSNKKKVMDDVDDFIKNLQSRSGFRSPKGVELALLGGTSKTGGASYEDAVEAFNRWMSHSLFCPNLLGISGGNGSGGASKGSFALGKKHFEAFMWILNKQTKDMEETVVGEQIIRRLMEMNFPEQNDKLYPKFRMQDSDDDQIQTRATTLDLLARNGFVDPKEDWVRDWLSLPEVQPGITLEKPSAPAMPVEGAPPKEPDAPKPAKMIYFIDERPAYENKVDFKALAESLDTAEVRFGNDLNDAFRSARDEFMKTIRRRGLLSANGDSADVARLTFNVGEIDNVVENWLVKLHLDSKLRALEELKKGDVPITIVRKFDDTPNETWEPIPPQAAIDFFNKKVTATIIKADGEKVLLTLADAKELAYYDDKAFAVAGIVRDDILNEAKQVILNGLKRVDIPGMEADLGTLFGKYIADGEIGAELSSPARLATIVRTNTLDALNQGRKALFEDPDVADFVAYWQYSAVIDDRTTDYCQCMDKKLFSMDDIGLLTPPAHYNCRSISVPVTKFETAGKEITISQPCLDRMASFLDIKRDPVNVPPASGTVAAPKAPSAASVPTVVPVTVIPKLDSAPAPKSTATIEAERRLREELSQMIVMCPYTFCRSREIKFISRNMNVGEYRCDGCDLPFRISSKGDLYLYDAGTETWERTSIGLFPQSFAEGINTGGRIIQAFDRFFATARK